MVWTGYIAHCVDYTVSLYATLRASRALFRHEVHTLA